MNWDIYIQRYQDELFKSVIPFWEKHCIDQEYGGYFTFLERDGSVYDDDKYMWMQWRIVYMFALLHRRYGNTPWLAIARHGADFLLKHGKAADGSYYFALNRRGEAAIAPYNIYSDCFAAMGAAALYDVTGEECYRREAEAAMQNYILRLDHPKGRWEKSLRGRRQFMSLGHYMMLANLGTVMQDLLHSDRFRADVDDACRKVLEQFWHAEFGVLFENVKLEGGCDLDSCDGRLLNPGHGLECIWFLLQHAREKEDSEQIRRIADMIPPLLDFSWDRSYGGIYYFMDVLAKPPVQLQAEMKLWWVHNEAILAVLHAYQMTGRDEFLQWFKILDDWTWNHFPDAEYGEWFAYLDRSGRPTHFLKGGKWKTFFHLPRFLMLSIDLMQDLNKLEDVAAR